MFVFLRVERKDEICTGIGAFPLENGGGWWRWRSDQMVGAARRPLPTAEEIGRAHV